MKLLRVLKLNTYLAKIESVSGIPPALFDLLILIIQVFVIGHLVACVWWGLSSAISIPGSSWFENTDITFGYPLKESSSGVQYLWSLYWTFATITTVGYGDIYACNTSERIINIFILMIGASTFGFIIANVSTVLDNFQRYKQSKLFIFGLNVFF
jgi:hypothetical protein